MICHAKTTFNQVIIFIECVQLCTIIIACKPLADCSAICVTSASHLPIGWLRRCNFSPKPLSFPGLWILIFAAML
jgi:hypothetical protein